MRVVVVGGGYAGLAVIISLWGSLPEAELSQLAQGLRAALAPEESARAPLMPQQVDQLGVLGLSAATLARLRPYITLLPERTPVNLNTAPADQLELGRKLVAEYKIQSLTSCSTCHR